MSKSIKTILFALAVVVSTPAHAKEDYKCACLEGTQSQVESNKKYKLICVETFKNHSSSVSVKEEKLSVYVDDKNTIQGDKDMSIRFRPRDGQCLEKVYDGNTKTMLWAGSHCNTSDYKTVGTFNLWDEKTETGATIWKATYKAFTSSRDYNGSATFAMNPKDKSDTKRYLQSLCIQKK